MTYDEALNKAFDAYLNNIIPKNKIEEYAKYLMLNHKKESREV